MPCFFLKPVSGDLSAVLSTTLEDRNQPALHAARRSTTRHDQETDDADDAQNEHHIEKPGIASLVALIVHVALRHVDERLRGDEVINSAERKNYVVEDNDEGVWKKLRSAEKTQ